MEISDSTPQKGSKRLNFLLLFLILGVTVVTLALAAAAVGQCTQPPNPLDGSTLSVKFVEPALGLPGFEALSWRDVLARVTGRKVRFWMYDWDIFNDWVDTILAPRVALRYGITIKRVPLQDTYQAVTQLATERGAGNNKNGSVDLVWINGENFHAAKAADNLYGPWTQSCPNAANFDWNAGYISTDDGTPTNGLEMPYNSVQNTYAYNPDYVWDNCTFDNVTATHCLPRSIQELLQWALVNPGRFTYPAPPDFHGTTFVKNVLVTWTKPDFLTGPYDNAKYLARAKLIMPILAQMQDFLAKDNVTGLQPVGVTESYAMFGAGQTWICMADNALDPGSEVNNARWPAKTRAFVPTTGTLRSSDFVAIGYNSPNILAAVVVGNEIADVAMQFSRRQPDRLAQLQAINPSAPTMTDGGWSVAFDAIKDAPQTPPRTALLAGAIAGIEFGYTDPLEKDWTRCVLNKSLTAPCV